MSKTAILILAAGSATRMGEPKQLLPYGAETLLEHAITQAMRTTADQVFCVLGAHAEAIKQNIKKDLVFIENDNWQEGLSSSIVCGVERMESLGFDAVLVMLADQPLIDTAYLDLLIKTSAEHKRACIASNYGAKNGVPAVFPKEFYNELKNLKGDQGAKDLLNAPHKPVIIQHAQDKIQDIDTPEDYARLLKK